MKVLSCYPSAARCRVSRPEIVWSDADVMHPLSEDCTLLAFSPKLLCIFISNRNVPRIIFSVNRFILWPICISRERDLREDKVGQFTYLCWHHLGWGEFENLENRDEMNTCQWNISQTFNSDWDVRVRPNARNWRQFHYALALLYQANVRARTVPVHSDCAHFSLVRLRAFSPLIGQYRWANILRPQTWQR